MRFTLLLLLILGTHNSSASEEVPAFFKGSDGENICENNLSRNSNDYNCSQGGERLSRDFNEFIAEGMAISTSLDFNLIGTSGHECFRDIRNEVQKFLANQLEGVCRTARCVTGHAANSDISRKCPAQYTCTAYTSSYTQLRVDPSAQLANTLTKLREHTPKMRKLMALAALNGLDYSDVYGLGKDIPEEAMRHPHSSQGLVRFAELPRLSPTELADVIKETVRGLDQKNREACPDTMLQRWAQHYSGTQVTRRQFPSYKCERRSGSRVLESRNQDSANLNPLDMLAGWTCVVDPSRTLDGPFVYVDNSPNPTTRRVQVQRREARRMTMTTEVREDPSTGNQFNDADFAACLARREVTTLIVRPPRTSAELRVALEKSYPRKDETPEGFTAAQVRDRHLSGNPRLPSTLRKNAIAGELNLQSIRDKHQAEYQNMINSFPLMTYVKKSGPGIGHADLLEPFGNTIKNVTDQIAKVGTSVECNGICTTMIDWDYLMYAPAAAEAIRKKPELCCNYARRVWHGRGVVNTTAAIGLAVGSIGGAIGCGFVTAGTAAVGCAIAAGTGLAAADALRANQVSGVASAIGNTGIGQEIDGSTADFAIVDAANEEAQLTTAGAVIAAPLDLAAVGAVLRVARRAPTGIVDDIPVPAPRPAAVAAPAPSTNSRVNELVASDSRYASVLNNVDVEELGEEFATGLDSIGPQLGAVLANARAANIPEEEISSLVRRLENSFNPETPALRVSSGATVPTRATPAPHTIHETYPTVFDGVDVPGLIAHYRTGFDSLTSDQHRLMDNVRRIANGNEDVERDLLRTIRRSLTDQDSDQLLRALSPRTIQTSDPVPPIFQNASTKNMADAMHRDYVAKNIGSRPVNEKPIILQPNETAEQALERYTREGFTGLRVEDGVLKQNIMQDPNQLVPSLHAKLNGRAADAYAPIVDGVGANPTADSLVSASQRVHDEWVALESWRAASPDAATRDAYALLIKPFNQLTPAEQVKDLDQLETLWKLQNPNRQLPASFTEARQRILQSSPVADAPVPGPSLLASNASRLAAVPELQAFATRNADNLNQALLDPETARMFDELVEAFPRMSALQKNEALESLESAMRNQCR
jgi:hypothetical protein